MQRTNVSDDTPDLLEKHHSDSSLFANTSSVTPVRRRVQLDVDLPYTASDLEGLDEKLLGSSLNTVSSSSFAG